MKYSQFNYLFDSKKYGYFIYNSANNSFHKISKDLFVYLENIKNNNTLIEGMDGDIKQKLIDLKVIVADNDDQDLITRKKFLTYSQFFSNHSLNLVVVPTMACNFACPYCYESNLPTKCMSDEIQKKLINFIESYSENNIPKPVSLCWHGGEPLSAFHVIKGLLEKLYSSPKIAMKSHALVSNGYLLTREKVAVLKKYQLESIQITIDGLEETHNKSRPHKTGKPTFCKILENVDYLLNDFPECRVKIRINIHKGNQKEFTELVRLLDQRWSGLNYGVFPSYVTEYQNCKVECIKLNERIAFLENLSHNKDFKEEINFYPKNKAVGCTATGAKNFVIGVDGEIYKCWVDVGKPEKVVGTIDNPYQNITLMSKYIVGSDMFSDKKCLECFLFPICDGGCNLVRFNNEKTGRIDQNLCPIDSGDMGKLLELHYERVNNLEVS